MVYYFIGYSEHVFAVSLAFWEIMYLNTCHVKPIMRGTAMMDYQQRCPVRASVPLFYTTKAQLTGCAARPQKLYLIKYKQNQTMVGVRMDFICRGFFWQTLTYYDRTSLFSSRLF